ncbi:MAG: MltA domain-containing protein, partial [Arcobacter sp.]|nr:MltA domain-containing protein [Arcobacter sp.]
MFVGCFGQPQYVKIDNISEANLKKVNWSELEAFSKDNLDEALLVFKKGCESPKTSLKKSCELANDTNNSKDFFTNNFTPYKLYDNDLKDKGLITGYYEPLLYGSRTKSERYKYPIYKTPKDLIIVSLTEAYPSLKGMVLRGKINGNKLIPYPTRKEIESKNDFDVICYVDDKLELFSLHIQGSGRVQLDTNE